MRWKITWAVTYRFLGWWQWLAGVGSVLFAGSLKANVGWWNQRWQFAGDALAWTQNISPVAAPLLILTLGFAKVVRDSIGPPWVATAIQRVLDQLQGLAFGDRGGPLHGHRVTLFKIVRFRALLKRWPWTRALMPVVRSGHATQKSRVTFRIPDDADKAEGIAGRTWAARKIVTLAGLPELGNDSPEESWAIYARETSVTVRWLRDWKKRDIPARSYYGIPVEVRGKIWGVIVLDSRDPKPIGPKARQVYNSIAKILAILVERSGT